MGLSGGEQERETEETDSRDSRGGKVGIDYCTAGRKGSGQVTGAAVPWSQDDQLEVHHPQVVHDVGTVPRQQVFYQLRVLQEINETSR